MEYDIRALLASLAQLFPPRSPTMRNPAPDSSLCRAAPRLHPLQLLLAAASASAAAPGHNCSIHFNCCSPIAPASAAARRLRPLQLLLPIASASAAIRLLLPDCVRFNCCSPIALAGFQPTPGTEHSSQSSKFRK